MSTPQQFKNRKAALDYLHKVGHEIKRATFYDACKDKKCIVEADGKTILLASLTDYINMHLAPTSSTADDLWARRKLKAEVETLEEKLTKAQIANREDDKAWMLRADHDQQVAAILGVFQEIMRREINIKIEDIISITGTDQDRKPELTAILKEAIDDAGNTLANTPEFDVLFGQENESDEATA